MGKCLYIFRETGTSVTASGIQEFIADTAIRPDSFAHHIYISSHFIAQIGNIVHKRDTRGKHRIGRIFRHLGRWNIHKINTEIIRQERPIKFSHYIFGPFTFYAHHHPVRRHKIFNSCAFFQKFRIRCHLKIHLLPAAIQFFPDNRLHLDCSPYGNRGFSNQNRIFLDVTSKSTGHVEHIPEIRTPVLIRRRTYSRENHLHLIEASRQISSEMQTTGFHIPFYQIVKPRFINRDFTLQQTLNLLLVDIHTGHINAHFRKTSTRHQAYIARAYNCYIHKYFLILSIRFSK